MSENIIMYNEGMCCDDLWIIFLGTHELVDKPYRDVICVIVETDVNNVPNSLASERPLANP